MRDPTFSPIVASMGMAGGRREATGVRGDARGEPVAALATIASIA